MKVLLKTRCGCTQVKEVAFNFDCIQIPLKEKMPVRPVNDEFIKNHSIKTRIFERTLDKFEDMFIYVEKL
jgi:hypothetical protein